MIDCNVHPTKKAVGLFAGQEIYESICESVLNQIKRDSAIKILKPTISSQPGQFNLLQDSFRQKMSQSILQANVQK